MHSYQDWEIKKCFLHTILLYACYFFHLCNFLKCYVDKKNNEVIAVSHGTVMSDNG